MKPIHLNHFYSKKLDAGLSNRWVQYIHGILKRTLDIRFPDLRPTTASLLLEENVHPKIVSELLGHSTITLTLNTYSHIIDPLGRAAADTMDDIAEP